MTARPYYVRCGNCGEERHEPHLPSLLTWFVEHCRQNHPGTVHLPTAALLLPDQP